MDCTGNSNQRWVVMAKRERKVDFLDGISAVNEQMLEKDQQVSRRRSEERGELNSVVIERIKLREIDTRPLNESHVQNLSESIAILGLIEPLAVDQDKVLLAGGHRLAAIKLLQETDIDSFNGQFPNGQIPVRVMPFKAANDPEKALQIEVAENEHRRDYTPAEVRAIADHLRESGYQDLKGRPKKGEKALMPALSVVIGKNRRTIQRYLYESDQESRTDVRLFLKKAQKALKAWQKDAPKSKKNKKLFEKLPEILDVIDDVLAD